MRNRRLALIFCALAVMAAAGCGPKAARLAPQRKGVVDLDRLTPEHPGWRGVSQFDEAIAELRRGSASGPAVLGDVSLETLPSIDISAPSRPNVDIASERSRLQALGDKQLSMLRVRKADERDLELSRQRRLWTVEAEQKHQADLKEIESRYAAEYDRIIADQTKTKLNLMLQIRALTDTIDHWKLSVPPAPELVQARKDLAEKQALYQTADSGLGVMVDAARLRRSNEIAAASEARADYVELKHAALEASLKAEDIRQLEREAVRLRTEREGLLAEVGAAETTSAPLVGSLGAQTSPEAKVAQAWNARDLANGAQRIARLRDRWRSFLRDDARVAAQDVATENNWSIAFGKPGPGAADLTPEVAAALKAGVWNSGVTSHPLNLRVTAGSKRN